MRIANNVEMLEINAMGTTIYPTFTWDDRNLVLIDAGFPGQLEEIKQAFAAAGVTAAQLTQIILTHQDIDHIGTVLDLLEIAPTAQVMAHEAEAPYIDGRKTPIKLAAMQENYENLPEDFKEMFNRMKEGFANRKIPITQTLSDGDVLPVCGGLEVIHTPGHTPGHISIFLRRSGILVCGDALNITDNEPSGPNPLHTLDLTLGQRSMEKARQLPLKAIVTYHCGYLDLTSAR